MIKARSLDNSTAKIIYSDDSQNIFSIPSEEILNLFKSSGLLLFRGFRTTHEQMLAFSEKFSSGYVRDPGKQTVDSLNGAVQLVDNGTGYIPPHCENAVSPFRPDVVWFCCAVPAVKGGETLFWDGSQVWEGLSEQARQIFSSKKIRFIYDFEVDNWKRFFGENTTINDAKRALEEFEGVDYFIRDDLSIHMEYVCSAVVKTRFNEKYAFANSLISSYKRQGAWRKIKSHFLKMYSSSPLMQLFGELPEPLITYLKASPQRVIFDDGSLIPNVIINEINTVMNKITGVISWQSGDLVMIDNSRFLHGRRKFKDTRRQIFSHLSYLKADL